MIIDSNKSNSDTFEEDSNQLEYNLLQHTTRAIHKAATMEEEILQDMIRDRETQIKMIKRKMEEQSRKMERLRKDLEVTKEKYSTQHVDQTMDLEKMHQRHNKLVSQLKETVEKLDMKKQQQQPNPAQLHLYNEVMKTIATPESRESSYVMRMQAQLCKAMHSMGMMETQLAVLQHQSKQKEKKLKDTVTLTVEEKSQVELELMNELVLADNGRREVETKHKEMIETFTKEKDALQEKIEKQQDAENASDKEDEEDDDEEEKEELKEILSQGREEIERMEQENKEESEKLEELKAKAIAIRGEPFVEELCASIAEEFKPEDEEESDEE